MYLNIKIKEDFRTLKANQEYNFDFSEKGWHLIVGDIGLRKGDSFHLTSTYYLKLVICLKLLN